MKLIDLHCDTMSKIIMAENKAELKENDFHVDLEKLIKANSLAQFFALYIDIEKVDDYFQYCLKMLDRFYQELEKNNEKIAIARSYQEMVQNESNGKISAFLTIEEGGMLKGKLYNLRNFYRLGVRLITLTWNYPNQIGYPNYKREYMTRGLTPFGREVVREMNRLGMIIDVSHLSDQGFFDVASISTKPFIASHSNARSVRNHPRNLTDEMIKILAEKGGVMGINFCSAFLSDSYVSKIEDIVMHIKHIRKVGGIDVIAIGSDYDGISCELEICNISKMDKLLYVLEKNGFSSEEIEKIFFKNAKRVIKEIL
ncbi:membrane dipeptidase [Caloranaerobacter azorensis DSM 13643]|uniref:Membrane dipeptidase n=1 Tax=Caloranaerobacter azorensis DSM 13643 TaxID=1121264 RepID=A0A1M5U955_9FIRM|nr:dipeptidase [Caloranaerobacter azorensis]SHH59451.1 membrane dipeptidase [Caloranaerobacter azorensis DSM 13643]